MAVKLIKKEPSAATGGCVADIWYSDKNAFSWLSNLAPRPFVLDGQRFGCVEQYYQFRKARLAKDTAAQDAILKVGDGYACGYASRLVGRRVKGLNQGLWETLKLHVMECAVRESFLQNPAELQRLRDLDPAVRFGHSRGDAYWSEWLSDDSCLTYYVV